MKSMKLIMCLMNTLRIMKCIRKFVTGMIIVFIASAGLMCIKENKKDILKAFRHLRKNIG